MSLDMFMDDCVTLQRKVVQRGAVGGEATPRWEPDTNCLDVPCSIQSASAGTQLRYMQRSMVVTTQLYFSYNYAPRTGDRFVNNETGVYYKVLGWNPSVKATEIIYICDAEEVVL